MMAVSKADEAYMNQAAAIRLRAEIADSRGKVAELERDLAEQCRLLGMGASREARLMARMTRMVDLMRKLREPDWHIESIREFQRELTALENAAMSDDSALRAMVAAEREACAKACDSLVPRSDEFSDEIERAESRAARDCAAAIRARGDK